VEGENWLFVKSGLFSYGNKLVLLLTGLTYTYLIANALEPELYGSIMYLLAFVGNLVYLFGTEMGTNVITVFTPKFKSRKLFITTLKVLGHHSSSGSFPCYF